jgi:hypothetical protein
MQSGDAVSGYLSFHRFQIWHRDSAAQPKFPWATPFSIVTGFSRRSIAFYRRSHGLEISKVHHAAHAAHQARHAQAFHSHLHNIAKYRRIRRFFILR